ncbi:MAG: LutB/LldF family L-lactate oxidation iron-sulfur protein [bacterium]|nr:LutB/LldF family L-lactate oxidation iron-sulfur protein [bacterium]
MTSPFNQRAAAAIADADLKEALKSATEKFAGLRQKAFESTAAPLALRAKAREIREHTFNHLDSHLETLFRSLEKNGVQVHTAPDAGAAVGHVLAIARAHGVQSVVKSKSMASEEIHLNHHLEAAGIQPFETDLGEWIIQLAGETPSHLIAPAIHKTRAQVARLFAEKVDPNAGDDPAELTNLARQTLRGEFLRAGMGISGVNFAIAETGTLCLVTNEGNGRMVTTLPKVHVAIMGLEKVVPTVEECMTLLAVLPRSGTGQKITSYFTMLTGPRSAKEADGPDEVHLILLDGGRTRHLGGAFQEAFHCIRCGACLNVCPVFQTVGGHAYDSIYGGPIGSILSPMLRGLDAAGELPAASSLCGACLEVCPVFVDIPRMLLEMRSARVSRADASLPERAAFRAAGFAMRHPALWEMGQSLFAFALRLLAKKEGWAMGPLRAWTEKRALPYPPRETFRARWRKREKILAQKKNASPDGAPDEKSANAGAVQKVRRALASGHGIAHGNIPAPPAILPEVAVPDAPARFLEEFAAVSGKPRRAKDTEAAREYIIEIARRFPDRPVALSADLTLPVAEWLFEAGIETIAPADAGDDRENIARAGVGITGCAWAIAETGTIVLYSGEGRPRLHSLLPEVHLALIPEDRIIRHLSALGPRLQEVLGGAPGQRPSCVNLITGPSRSADIELTLVEGVHGPREVHAILLPAGGGASGGSAAENGSPFLLEEE